MDNFHQFEQKLYFFVEKIENIFFEKLKNFFGENGSEIVFFLKIHESTPKMFNFHEIEEIF